LISISACTSGPPPPVDARPYGEQIAGWRAAKDALFRSAESPLPPEKRAAFTGLPYYPIDPAFHVPARLTPEAKGPAVFIELPTSRSERRRMRRIGTLGFTLGEAPYTLTAFAEEDDTQMKRLFVPFGDLTSAADETYKGGRYIELDRTSTGLYDLDFNRAYHPFCVFNSEYDCPVPPTENRLAVAIRAGERLGPPSH
jgi:uncharacterized protein (DUF1684 family)